jgi:outer membrane autotransporter protein
MSIKRANLLASTALVAVVMAAPGFALATELDDGMTITVDNTTGLLDSDNDGGNIAITIDSTAGAITLGAQGTHSLESSNDGKAQTITVTVTSSGTANGVTFADDVIGNNVGDVITINSTNDNLTFQGNVTSQGGAINMGSGSADPTLTVTFDTANNENLTINATVGAVDAADTVTMVVSNSDSGNANTITFSQAIGGATAANAIDTLTVGANTTATFSSSVRAGTVNLNSANTTTFSNNVIATTVNFGADGTAEISSNRGVDGAVTTTTTDTGALIFGTSTSDTTLVSGAIGTSTTKLKAVTADAGAGMTASFGGDVNATTVTLTGTNNTAVFAFAGDVNATTLAIIIGGAVNIAADKNLTAAVTASADGVGILNFAGTSTVTGAIGATGGGNRLNAINVNGGTVTLSDTFAAATTTVASGATLKTGGAITFEGALNNNGTLSLGGTLTATSAGGTIDLANTGNATLALASTSAYTNGVVIASDDNNVSATNTVTVTPHANFTSGTLTLVDTGTGTVAANTQFSVADNLLTSYAITGGGGATDLVLTATQKSATTVASTLGTTTDAANALAAGVAATASDTTLTTAYNTAVQAGGAEAKKAAEQSQPNITAAAAQAITAASRSSADAVSARLASARTGTQVAGLQQTGVAAGDGSRRNGGWGKVFGNVANQDDRDGVAGYDSHTYGLAVGMDNKVTDTVRVGAALSYARSNVDGNDAGNSDTDIDSYQVAVYGSYEPGAYYVEGQLAYAFNSVDTSRDITFGGLDRTAKGSYDANQYSATLGAGVPMKHDAFTITPKAGLFYAYTNSDSYTETGAGGMNLVVNPDDTSMLEGSLGVNVAYDHKVEGGLLRPEVRAAVLYEFLDDNASATSRFTGAGATFNTEGLDTAQLGGTLGFGVGYTTADGMWEIRGDYDAELRQDFVGHTGMLTGRINF